jgi:hypothetical protein
LPQPVNATRRHRISGAHYRVRNLPAYEAGLKRRGDLTLWINEAALDGWRAPRRNTPGGSDLAIEMVLMLRMVFHLALRRLRHSPAACCACWISISVFPITQRLCGQPGFDNALLSLWGPHLA